MIELCLLALLHVSGQGLPQPTPTQAAAPQNAAGAQVSSFTKDQIMVSAKTVALAGAVGEVAAYGLAMNPSAAKAKEILEKEVKKWGRFTIVETPEQADLVMLLVEGNRAAGGGGTLKTSLLLVAAGGPAAGKEREAYWNEAKTGSILGVSAGGKVISDFRHYLEELDNRVAKVTLPPGWQLTTARSSGGATQSGSTEAQRSQEQKPPPRPSRYVSPYELMSKAKTYCLTGKGPYMEHGTWEKIVGIGKYANVPRALEEAYAALAQWGRLSEETDPLKADLVVRVYQWDERAESSQFHGVSTAMIVFEGGPAYQREDPGLWISGNTNSSPKDIVGFFRGDLEQYEKHQPGSWAGEGNKDFHRASDMLAAAGKKAGDWRSYTVLEAIAEYRKSLRKDPAYLPAHDGLGRALLDLDFDAAAAFEFQLVLESPAAPLETLMNLAKAMGKIPDREAAQSAISRAMEISAGDARKLDQLGTLLYGEHDYEHSIAAYKEAAKLNPSDQELLFRLGKAQYRAGRYKEAETSFQALLKQSPEHQQGLAWMGSTLNYLDRSVEAIPYLRKSVALNPKDDSAHYELARALTAQNNYDEATTEARKALEVIPKSPLYHLELGSTLLEAGKYTDAMKELIEAAKLEPGNAQTRNMLGGCLLKVGMAVEAEKEFATATQLDPRSGVLYYNLGQAREAKGDKSGAAEAYRKAAELDPKNAMIARKMEEISK
jgi:tetratricopeptide (TPR) repeat protein